MNDAKKYYEVVVEFLDDEGNVRDFTVIDGGFASYDVPSRAQCNKRLTKTMASRLSSTIATRMVMSLIRGSSNSFTVGYTPPPQPIKIKEI